MANQKMPSSACPVRKLSAQCRFPAVANAAALLRRKLHSLLSGQKCDLEISVGAGEMHSAGSQHLKA